MKRLELILFSNIPAPYFVDYCSELAKYANVTAVFETTKASNRNSSWYKHESKGFETVYLKNWKIGQESALAFGFKKLLRAKSYDLVLVCNPTTPTGILLISYLKRHKMRYAIQSEGGFVGSQKGLKEAYKKHLISGASFYLSGMSNRNDYFSAYAHHNAVIHRYHFASFREYQIDIKPVEPNEKRALRNALGITEDNVVLYVGHFIKAKGYDDALHLARRMQGTGFYFAGGEPSRKDLEFIKENQMSNAHFLGFLNQESLCNYYRAATLLILPTYSDTWGLVINEAMSKGLPVVTTDACIAGLEFFQESHPECLSKVGDIDDLQTKVEQILGNPTKVSELISYSLASVKPHTIENMAKEIYNHIEQEVTK